MEFEPTKHYTSHILEFEMSDSIGKLASAQVKVQQEIKDLPKESKGFAHKYTTFDKLVQYLRPLLSKHGISFVQMPCGRDENVGVITLYMHTSGEYITSKIETQIIDAQNKYQSMGSAITYFKRYSLASFVGIASDEDTDGNVTKSQPKPQLTPLNKHQIYNIKGLIKNQTPEFQAKVLEAISNNKLHQKNIDAWLQGFEKNNKENK